MAVEIERKFLVKKATWNAIEKGKGNYYRQGYMAKETNQTIRVRVTEETGYLTIKGPTTGISRPEYEYKIPKQDAEEMLNIFCNNIVCKIRYKIEFANKLWEVDEFMNDNEGLIVAEIELRDENEKFDLPDWVEKEVTGEKRYNNSKLAVNPYKNWVA